MKRWTSMLAIVLILGSGSILTACGPPDDVDERELDDSMDGQPQDDGLDDGGMGDGTGGGDDDW